MRKSLVFSNQGSTVPYRTQLKNSDCPGGLSSIPDGRIGQTFFPLPLLP